jgi:hypothetical protein
MAGSRRGLVGLWLGWLGDGQDTDLWKAYYLTTFTPCFTGPVNYPFASCHEGPGFNPQGGTYVKLGFSC